MPVETGFIALNRTIIPVLIALRQKILSPLSLASILPYSSRKLAALPQSRSRRLALRECWLVKIGNQPRLSNNQPPCINNRTVTTQLVAEVGEVK